MTRRFTDTQKWEDDWFSDLSLKNKIIWLCVLDCCDHVGIYKRNDKMLKYFTNEDVGFDQVTFLFREKILLLNEDAFIVEDFARLQYEKLNKSNVVHQSAIKTLVKYGLSFDENFKIILKTS